MSEEECLDDSIFEECSPAPMELDIQKEVEEAILALKWDPRSLPSIQDISPALRLSPGGESWQLTRRDPTFWNIVFCEACSVYRRPKVAPSFISFSGLEVWFIELTLSFNVNHLTDLILGFCIELTVHHDLSIGFQWKISNHCHTVLKQFLVFTFDMNLDVTSKDLSYFAAS